MLGKSSANVLSSVRIRARKASIGVFSPEPLIIQLNDIRDKFYLKCQQLFKLAVIL